MIQETSVPDETGATEETTQTTAPTETLPQTQPTVQPTLPEESTEATEETEPDAFIPGAALTVAECWAMGAGAENVTVQGTVVFASGNQAVLQDDTGGIRLSFGADPGIMPEDILLATGKRSGGLYVQDFEILGQGTMPYVETTLLDAPDSLRVCIRNALVDSTSISQQGFSMTLIPEEPVAGSMTADVWGVILDGYFYADTILPTAQDGPDSSEPEQEIGNWKLFFGLLHAHTTLSDGADMVEEAFQYASGVGGLDFFAVTDHSDSFDNAAFGSVDTAGSEVSQEWAAGKAAAQAVTDGSFVGIFGYEMSWPESYALGHINTFNTPGWQAWTQAGFTSLKSYYTALAQEPDSISQFNHPGNTYGNFRRFSDYRAEYDAVMHLLELGTGEDALDYYIKALDEGWHLAPSNHTPAPHKHLAEAMPEARTVVLAEKLTEDAIYDAIRSHRVYTTEDGDLEIGYTLGNTVMGSVIAAGENLTASISLKDPTDTGSAVVEILSDGGSVAAVQRVDAFPAELSVDVKSGYHYYFLKITQSDGDVAVTAPVWADHYEDLGIRSLTASEQMPMQGQEVMLELELYNEENTAFTVESILFYENGTLLHESRNPGTVNARSILPYRYPITRTQPGEVKIRAEVTGTIAQQRRTFEKTLTLRFQAAQITHCTIEEARSGTLGSAYRVKGYVTAGNHNPYNTFENTLYLQDSTGGIAVMGCDARDVQKGAPMEAEGVLREQGGNLVLELTDYVFPEETYYLYVPKTVDNKTAMDYENHGGELMQIEGTVVSLTKTADGEGISRLTLQDAGGNRATVLIEDNIRSGAYGTNELAARIKKGRTVRAIGLLHMDEFGAPVLRVRNCEEVVYVPAAVDASNPKTGDRLAYLLHLFFGRE